MVLFSLHRITEFHRLYRVNSIEIIGNILQTSSLRRTLSLFILLFSTWLVWSGFYTSLLLGLGGLSCLFVVLLSRRMDIIDPEGHPNHLFFGLLTYIPWLAWETIKANIDISWRIIQPSLPIAPRVIRIKTSQKTHLGQVIYANSITLTPGTVSVEVEEGEITVHALTNEAADELLEGSMDRRVTRLEGER